MVSLNTIFKFTEKFKTEKDCLEHLKEIHGTSCRHCGHPKTYEYKKGKRNLFKCLKCQKQFTLKISTIFEKSRLPLKKWFMAMYLLNENSKGISSKTLAKQIGVTQKTAWFMYHRVRETYKQNSVGFSVIVEVDETFVGGKEKNKHASKKK